MWEDNAPGSGTAETAPTGQTPSAEGGDKGKSKKDDSVQLSKREYEAILKERDELRESERYWAESARGTRHDDKGGREPEEHEEDLFAELGDADDDNNPEALTDELGTQGLEALRKRGVITRKELKAILSKSAEQQRKAIEKAARDLDQRIDSNIDRRTKAMAKDAALLEQYPELKDAKSDFTVRAGEIFKEIMADDPDMAKPAALRMAARLTRAELGGESARQRRIQAQSGEYGRRGGSDPSDDDLSPFQRELIKKFNADGGPQISEDAYRKRAKSGVNMASHGAYQPGSMNWGND